MLTRRKFKNYIYRLYRIIIAPLVRKEGYNYEKSGYRA